jgi:membrane protein YqaA with SNARE-associated domain
MNRTVTPVTISRSENRWMLVILLAAVGALGGFLGFWILHKMSGEKLRPGRGRPIIAGVLSVGIGAGVAYKSNYLNQDVWTTSANTWALWTAAFTAATSGPLVTGVLGKLYEDRQDPTKDSLARRAMNKVPRRGATTAEVSHPG